MPMTNTAAFAQTPDTASVVVTQAVTNLSSLTPTNIVTAFTAGPNGAIGTRASWMPRGATAAGGLYMFKSTDSGATWHIKDSVSIPLVNPTAGANLTGGSYANFSETRPMRLGAGDMIGFGSGVAQASGIDVDFEFTNF